MCGRFHGADGDRQWIVEIIEGEFFGCEFSSDKTVEKGGGGKHIAEAFDRNISGSKRISKNTLRRRTREAPEFSALGHHRWRRKLTDSREGDESDAAGSQDTVNCLHCGARIVNVHEDMNANDTVERVGGDAGSVDEIGEDCDAFARKNVKNIPLGNSVFAIAVHILFFANLDAPAADIMSVAREKLLDVNTIDALTAEPPKRGAVGFEAAQLGEIGDAIEGQHGALGFPLLDG